MKTVTTSVGFQDPLGNLVLSGNLILTLSQAAEVTSGGGLIAPKVVVLALSATTAKIASTQIWFNDELTPTGTTYHSELLDSGGNIIADFGQWSITGASADLSTMVPVSTFTTSLPGVVLTAPAAAQTVVQPTGTSLNVNRFENIRFADQFAGADIGAKINAAFADGGNLCSVYVPMPAGGVYNYSTTIVMPVGFYGQLSLIGPMDVELHYTGSGDALQAFGTGQAFANITIENIKFSGTSSGSAGIHVKAFNGLRLNNVAVTGFSTGDGLKNEGANQVDCFQCTFDTNYNGVHNVGVVVSATNYSVNAARFVGGQIALNTNFGLFEDASIGTTVFPNQNNLYMLTFENNGSNTSSKTVAASGAVRAANVSTITTTTAHGLTTGQLVSITGVPVGSTDFNGHWIVTVTGTTTFTYAQTGTSETQSGGTVLRLTGNAFVQGGTGINFSNGYMEYTGANVRQSNMYFGDSNFQPSNPIIAGAWFGSANATNSIDNFNSNGLSVQACREDAVVTNFVLQGTASRKLVLEQNIALGVTNYVGGSDAGDSTVIFPNGFPLTTWVNGQGPTLRGWGFNAVSGLGQDLSFRTRSGGTYIWRGLAGGTGTQNSGLDDSGNFLGTTYGNFANSNMKVLYSGNDIVTRVATTGVHRLQDQTGATCAEFSTATAVLASKITTYNSIATAGNGAASVYGATSQKTESAADTNVLTFTPPAAVGSYRVRFSMDVSAQNTATLGWTATWTDSNGSAQAPTNLALFTSGTAAPALTVTAATNGHYYGSLDLDTNAAGTAIVVKLTFTGTSFTAKVSATVERLI